MLGCTVGAADTGVSAEGATISRTSVITGVYWHAAMAAKPMAKNESATAKRMATV